jgi:prevent-host-death family protein
MSHLCYDRRMADVASRDLRNNTREVLARVESGEEITITVAGRPVARLQPVERRTQWVSRAEFVHRFADRQADAGLASELAALAPDTTDDLA